MVIALKIRTSSYSTKQGFCFELLHWRRKPPTERLINSGMPQVRPYCAGEMVLLLLLLLPSIEGSLFFFFFQGQYSLQELETTGAATLTNDLPKCLELAVCQTNPRKWPRKKCAKARQQKKKKKKKKKKMAKGKQEFQKKKEVGSWAQVFGVCLFSSLLVMPPSSSD